MVTYFPSPSDLPPLLNKARSLSAAGHSVEVLCHTDRPELARAERDLSGFSVVRIYSRTRRFFSWAYGLSPRSSVVAAFQYLLTYTEFNIRVVWHGLRSGADLYEAHDLPTLPAALLVSRLRGKPVLYHAHELHAETHRHVRFATFWKLLERGLVPFAESVVTPEENRSEILRAECGARRPPLTVMNCPPYRLPIRSDRLREALRQRNLFPRFVALYQGLFSEDRCIDELISAARYLDDGVALVLMGHGFGAYADLSARVEDSSRVIVLPRVPYDELLSYTASADAGVLLYRNTCRNNFFCAPNKLHEYMMMGLPVIANDYPGVRAVVEGEQVGVTVNCEDPAAIGDAINSLARCRETYARYRTNALTVTREKFNWERQFSLLEPEYARLLSGQPSAVAGAVHT
jgi:glycosyltransferase involved in cell wall biosynthesis